MAGELILVIDDSPTITKAVQLVLMRAGYRVEIASDGEAGLEAARRETPSLILLDFVMPRMNGYQVCVELAADPELSSVPVVLMSAKGDQVGERFVKMMGIVEYVTKPFSSETLAEVVVRALGRPAASAAAHPLLDDTFDGLDEPAAPNGHGGPGRAGALARLRDELVAAMAARLEGAELSASALAGSLRAALDEETLARVLDEVQAESEGDLRGDLRTVALPEILQLIEGQALSGSLVLQRGGARIEVALRRGRVEQATGRGLPDELRLGRFLLDRELLDAARFESFLQARAGGGLLGQELVSARMLGAPELRGALARQSSELVYEALRWRSGTFRFRAGFELPAAAQEANLALSLETLVHDGCRRVDEWHLLERLIDGPHAVFARDDTGAARHKGRLSREEQLVLERIDGARPVAELVTGSRLGSYEVFRALYRLLSIKLVRRADS